MEFGLGSRFIVDSNAINEYNVLRFKMNLARKRLIVRVADLIMDDRSKNIVGGVKKMSEEPFDITVRKCDGKGSVVEMVHFKKCVLVGHKNEGDYRNMEVGTHLLIMDAEEIEVEAV